MNSRVSAVVFLAALSGLCASCASAPRVSGSGQIALVRFGAGSMEDEGAAPNRAAAPGGIRLVRADETVARCKILSQDIDAHLAAGDYAASLSSYDSLVSLAGSNSSAMKVAQDARIHIEEALDRISFEAVSQPAETVAGTAFGKDFSVRVSASDQDGKKPLAGLLCTVYYPAVAEDGSRVTLAESRTSDADGLVTFAAPVPARAARSSLIVAAALGSDDPRLRESIEQRKNRAQLACAIPWLVSTNAKRVSTTISVLDYDKNGKPIFSNNPSATILLKPLVQRGFRPIGMADFPTQIAAGDDAALIKAAKAQFGSAVQRFIYGTSSVESLVQGADQQWLCTLVARIKVWDFAKGALVYETELRHTASAKTEDAAIHAARAKLSGELLVNDLCYNL